MSGQAEGGSRSGSGGGSRESRGRQQRRGGPRRKRRKECAFCTDRRGKIIDYKNVRLLRDFLDDRARIRKARQTGNCRKHQRKLGTAIKRAREIALLDYTAD